MLFSRNDIKVTVVLMGEWRAFEKVCFSEIRKGTRNEMKMWLIATCNCMLIWMTRVSFFSMRSMK